MVNVVVDTVTSIEISVTCKIGRTYLYLPTMIVLWYTYMVNVVVDTVTSIEISFTCKIGRTYLYLPTMIVLWYTWKNVDVGTATYNNER